MTRPGEPLGSRRRVTAVLTGIAYTLWGAAAATQTLSSDELLAQARQEMTAECAGSARSDALFDVLCAGALRVGVRSGYPLFAEMRDGERSGFEISIAAELGARLGVTPAYVPVTPTTRIASLAEGRTDVALATMGHNSVRDGEARFVRPHYYSSETMIVGLRQIPITGWEDIADKTVCVTVGNYSNATLAPRVARLMLFDQPSKLLAGLESGTCRFIAQDDSVLAPTVRDPDFAARFEPKLSFSEVPWGMAVARDGAERLAAVLDALSRDMHADGTYLRLAKAAGIATGFLEREATRWRDPACRAAPYACLQPPLETRLAPSNVADLARRIEAATAGLGLTVTLNMMHTKIAWEMFLDGLVISIVAIVGVLVATLVIAVGLGWILARAGKAPRLMLRGLVIVLQSAPTLLILAATAAVTNALFTFSLGIALLTAILAIGLMNGAFAGQAIADAYATLGPTPGPRAMGRAIARSSPQIEAFLVNSTRGVAAASFVGVTDLTNTLTDISAFSSNQATTYWVLLVFYVAVVFCVVWGARRLRTVLERAEAAR